MKRLQLFIRGFFVRKDQLSFAVVEEGPETAQEFMHAVDAVRVPRFRLFERAEEHLVHAQCVGAVVIDDVVGVHDVEHRLRHLFDRPAADVPALFEDELRILEFGAPCAERVEIEYVVAHDVHIDVDLLGFVLVFQSERYEFVGADHAIDEIRTALDHTLIDEFLERLRFADISQVVEEHVPEARIHQVPCRVFDAADVEIDVAPVFVGGAAHERPVVVRVHVAQVVGRRSGESGHRGYFEGIAFGRRPLLDAGQGRFALFGRAEVVDRRQLQRQPLFRQRIGRAFLVVDRERLAPVALTREDGVAQAVVH